MSKIVITRKIPGEAFHSLVKDHEHEVVVSPYDRPLKPEELVEVCKGADAIMSLLTDTFDADVFEEIGPQLKVISNYAVGYDNINLDDATKAGIVVTNTPSDEVNESVAEHTWALILAVSRRVVESDEAVRGGAYFGWEPDIFIGDNLYKKTLGIVGMGRIGRMVATKAAGFNMKVIYHNRSRDEQTEQDFGIEYVEFEDLLKRSDYVTLHVPLEDETRHLMNAETLSKMKHGSYLINTARGGVIDEHDLAKALKNGHLAGAAIDVFDNEPYFNPEFLSMENIVMTPHIASATVDAREKMGAQAVGSIYKVLKGERPEELVNEEVWDKRRT